MHDTDRNRETLDINLNINITVKEAKNSSSSLVANMLIGIREDLTRALASLATINITERNILATAKQMLDDLNSARLVTDEIALDLDTLISKQIEGGLTAEEAETVAQQIRDNAARLREVAAKYTPTTPITE